VINSGTLKTARLARVESWPSEQMMKIEMKITETEPKIFDVLNELIQREPIFHRPELGTTRADFSAASLPFAE
jgi:hypothetical protein